MKQLGLLLVFLVAALGSPLFSIDRTMGMAMVDMVTPQGARTPLMPLSEPDNGPSLCVGAANEIYIATMDKVTTFDFVSQKVVANMTVPSGGSLRHVAYDLEMKRLFGIYQSNMDVISVVELTDGNYKMLYTFNITGRVHLCYYGVTTHHYGVMIFPDNMPGSIIFDFIDMVTLDVFEQNVVQAGLNIRSFAIDYINHNVWAIWWNATSSLFDFGIIHMTGQLQQIQASFKWSQVSSAATVDITQQRYYSAVYEGSQAYWASYRLSNGVATIANITWDQEALAWGLGD